MATHCGGSKENTGGGRSFTKPTVELIPAVEETHTRAPDVVKSKSGDGSGLVVAGKCGGEKKENPTSINQEKLLQKKGELHGSGRSGCNLNVSVSRNTNGGLRVAAGNFRKGGAISVERGGADGCGSGGGPGCFAYANGTSLRVHNLAPSYCQGGGSRGGDFCLDFSAGCAGPFAGDISNARKMVGRREMFMKGGSCASGSGGGTAVREALMTEEVEQGGCSRMF
ncbi:hypothetical protein BVRB_9g222170 [Beta vulgaris subsp. vulgaris]|nr:hypothetical protein BVRB_9g222170 [Beta vulgaris subsp. vulgaris]